MINFIVLRVGILLLFVALILFSLFLADQVHQLSFWLYRSIFFLLSSFSIIGAIVTTSVEDSEQAVAVALNA